MTWRGNERVTVVTEVKVGKGETAGKVGMRMRWWGNGGRENVGSHVEERWAAKCEGRRERGSVEERNERRERARKRKGPD